MIPDEKVVWFVTESNLSFLKDKSEWTSTTIVFEITERDNKTLLRFTHVGLKPEIECYNACFGGWSKLIQQSLFSSITTSEGQEVF